MENSELGKFNFKDFLKGLYFTIILAIGGTVKAFYEQGTWPTPEQWTTLGKIILFVSVMYVIKQVTSNKNGIPFIKD